MSNQRILIRPIDAADRAAWEPLWRGYLDFYQTRLPPEQYNLHFARLTDPDEPAITGRVAEIDGALAGLAHCIWHPHGWHVAPVCYLQDLFTAPDHRRRGVAEALIRAVYADADAGGAANVYWTTQSFNDTARRLYDRVGRLTPFLKYDRA